MQSYRQIHSWCGKFVDRVATPTISLRKLYRRRSTEPARTLVREAMRAATLRNASFGDDFVTDNKGKKHRATDFIRDRVRLHHKTWIIGALTELHARLREYERLDEVTAEVRMLDNEIASKEEQLFVMEKTLELRTQELAEMDALVQMLRDEGAPEYMKTERKLVL